LRRFLALIVVGVVAVGLLLTPATAQADFGIDPGKVFIENLYPGAEADIPITIYNQNDYETAFKVRVREPDYTETGYEAFPYLWAILGSVLGVLVGGGIFFLVKRKQHV